MHIPIRGPVPRVVPHGDKVIHFVAYCLLAWLGGRHQLATRRSRSVAVLIMWAAAYAAYATADEWLQSFVGRTMSLGDWLADLLGVTVATVVLALGRRPSGLSEHEDKLPRQL
jgi:VanZ family protein